MVVTGPVGEPICRPAKVTNAPLRSAALPAASETVAPFGRLTEAIAETDIGVGCRDRVAEGQRIGAGAGRIGGFAAAR